MSGSDMDVFAVQVGGEGGLWDANCCNPQCGQGIHNLVEDLPSEEEAEKAVEKHRKELRRMRKEEIKANRVADLKDLEEKLAEYERRFGPLHERPWT